MKNIRKGISGLTATVTLASLRVATTVAQSGGIQGGMNAAHGEGQPTILFGDGGIFTTVVNVMLFIIGAVAVIMIIFGGLRYIISGGNANSVTAAKNTILYAIVGVIIALLSYAIINFVVNNFSTAGGNTSL